MKILICGGTGQLGRESAQVLKVKHDVITLGSHELDITRPEMVKDVIQQFKPDTILNCAAYTRVDECESKREQAWRVNVEGARNLAMYIHRYGGKLVHLSTDYVFDGKKEPPEPYVEDDVPAPLSYYGITKLESERVVREITDQHIIIRTAWMYSARAQNFLTTLLKRTLNKPACEIRIVNDRFGSPTWAYRLALQIRVLVELDCQGTWHATSEGHCSWYELACYFLDRMKVRHVIVPCATRDYPTVAERPGNSILENRNLKQAGTNLMQDWQHDVDQFISGFREFLLREAKS